MPLLPPAPPRRPDPAPLVTDDRRAVLVGTTVWAVLLVVTLLVRDDLLAAGRGWWTGTCLTGVVLGLAGLGHLHRRNNRRPTRPAQD